MRSENPKYDEVYRIARRELNTQLTQLAVSQGYKVPPSLTLDQAIADLAILLLNGERPGTQFDEELKIAGKAAGDVIPNSEQEVQVAQSSLAKLVYGE